MGNLKLIRNLTSKMKHSKNINTSLLILIMVNSLLSIPKIVMCNNDDDGIRGKSETPLDIAYPILISEKEASPSKSYFGYSVSLAKGKSGQEKSSQDPYGWIFIGAPKSNSSSTMYKDKGEAPLEPGVVWRCSLGRNPSIGDSCEMMNVDPTPNEIRPNAPVMESHNGAWIGVTLEVNYGRLLTCGMRWNRGMLQFYNGICYWFADVENSKRASYRSNDLSKLVDRGKYDQRLTTFFRSDATQDRLFTFTNSLNESSRGHEWQISQAGMSVHLFQDNHNLENGIESMPSLLIGAPGVREWSGAVVLYTNTITPRPDMARPNRNQEDPTFSEFLVGNRGIVPTPETQKLRNHWNEYFGYSVTSGRYFNKTGKILYAAGAPRAEHSGEVVIFDFPPYQYPSATYKRQVEPLLEIKAPENSFGSYFGSVLHTVDLNGDGVDELFVGAPLYTFDDTESSGKEKDGVINNPEQINPKLLEIKEKSGKSYEIGDHGSVFFFSFFNVSTSKNGTESGEKYRMQGLSGSKIPRARFGSAISSIVFNLNNGTRDVYLVVGAPYEYNSDEAGSETTGAVYLYQYLSNSGKFGGYSQRIMASTISSSLKGFGSSLSIPTDVDWNGTPDIAVGAYQSGHAVVFRTRPKIEINSWMKFVSNEDDDINEVRRGSPQFYLESCFSVAENLGLIKLDLDIWVRLKFFDPSIRFAEEVIRLNPRNSGNEIIYNKRNVSAHTARSCEKLIVLAVHKEGIGMDDSDIIAEIAHPLHFIQEVWYNETLQRPLTVTNYFAFDDAQTRRQRQTDRTAATFHSFDSRKPSPQYTKTAQDLPISLNDCMDKVCRPEIHMKWSFFNEKNESIDTFLLGSSKEIRMEILISNTRESAIEPWLTLDWSLTHIREATSGTPWLNRTCIDQSHSDTKIKNFRCPLGRYIKKGRSINIVIHFNMEDFFVSEPNNIRFIVNGAVRFQEMRNEPVITQGILSLYVPKTEVVFRGSMRNVTLRTPLEYSTTVDKEKKDKKLLFASFRHEFSVEVLGASVQKLQARFQLPVALNADSGPLFLIKRPYILSTNGKAFQNSKCDLVPSRYNFHEITFTNVPLSHGAFSAEGGDGHSLSFHEKFLLTDEFARRWKREANRKNVAVPIGMDTPVTPSSRKSVKETPMQVSDDTTVTLRCGEANCLEVECDVDNVKAHNLIYVAFEIYPIAENIEKLLKSEEKLSILVEATGSGQIFSGRADALHEDNDVSQRMLVKISNKQVDTWVYIVATLGGILLLALIIVGLYKCGFFKREKLQQLNQMKAEHHRKSMVAAARASILQVAGGGDGVDAYDGQSQEVLTEAEHINEDTELQEKSGGSGGGGVPQDDDNGDKDVLN